MFPCCIRNPQMVGLCFLVAGLILLLLCVPVWLWLAVLGLVMAAFGICVLIRW